MGNQLIFVGLIIIATGLILNFIGLAKIPLLPGDIYIKRENFSFYFPIATSILISIILTVIIRFFK